MKRKSVKYDLRQAHHLLKMYEKQVLNPNENYAHVHYTASPLEGRIEKRLGKDAKINLVKVTKKPTTDMWLKLFMFTDGKLWKSKKQRTNNP